MSDDEFLIPKDRDIYQLWYFDEYNVGERYGLKKSILKFYKDQTNNRLFFDFISIHTIYSGLASFSAPGEIGYMRLLGKTRATLDKTISNRPDTVLLQCFNRDKDGYFEGMILYSSQGGERKPYIAAKKMLVERTSITDQEPKILADNYCRSLAYDKIDDMRTRDIYERCQQFSVRNGVLFLIGP
ncbi:MAG: hypothetical protein AAF684_01130 [Pseudomonadota bacterium]